MSFMIERIIYLNDINIGISMNVSLKITACIIIFTFYVVACILLAGGRELTSFQVAYRKGYIPVTDKYLSSGINNFTPQSP
jgi:hypothetical protein